MSNALSRDDLATLAEYFADEQEARLLLESIEFRRSRHPRWQTAELFWSAVGHALNAGAVADAREKLFEEAARRYPYNPLFTTASRRSPASPGRAEPAGAGSRSDGLGDGPVTCTILMVDAVGFSKLNALGQRAWRKTIYDVTATALAASGILPENILRQEDRGDGYLALVDVGVSLPTVVADFARELGIALAEHNALANDASKVRLRVAVNQGFVLFDPRGFTSEAVVVAARLCDAEPVKAALRAEPAANVALVLSENVFQATVAQRFRGLDETNFRKVDVRNEKFDGNGWLQVDGHRPAPPAAAGSEASAEASAETDAAGDDEGPWDFFVSYAKDDEDVAQWVTEVLEDAGYSVHASYLFDVAGRGKRMVVETGMERSEKTIAVLTPAYLTSPFVYGQWGYAWNGDPNGVKRKLVPVKVKQCQPDGFLAGITFIDLVGREEPDAAQHLLEEVEASIKGRRKRRPGSPVFPPNRG